MSQQAATAASTQAESTRQRSRPRWRIWLRRGFLTWAIVSTTWLANSYRTREVDAQLLQSSEAVEVVETNEYLLFSAKAQRKTALIFVCGSGVVPEAYAPLLRPIAEEGHLVAIVKLPYRFAPLESHKAAAIARVQHMIEERPEVSSWVLSGHSLGAALSCRVALENPAQLSALVLVGTTHPKSDNLSVLQMPVYKVYGSHDGVAPEEKVLANKSLLPDSTTWVRIEGANHSQFGHYGHQLLDGTATISRDEQQASTRAVLLKALRAQTN